MKKQRVEGEVFKVKKTKHNFADGLLKWNREQNKRQMPWKGEKDPYKIWLSEIILQQTRVEQGLKYYQNFIATFPTVQALANAPEEKVFKLWEGLGYYSRCRNLIASAKYITAELDGVFPDTYGAILGLKGVGEYTAAAIGSFAYNLPHAVLDGNVYRVLSRIHNSDTPIDSLRGKKEFSLLAQQNMPQKKAGEYNQAIMDFGATVCKPAPVCSACFYQEHCEAYLQGRQQLLPIKEKKLTLKKRWLNYFIVRCNDEVLVQQRTEKDVWNGLFQFVLIETEKEMKTPTLQTLFQQQFGITEYSFLNEWKEQQTLSHQLISFRFFIFRIAQKAEVEGYHWIGPADLALLAFPKTLQAAIQTHLVNPSLFS